MNAMDQVRKHLNAIHADLTMRGVQSQVIENATYSIECLSRAYLGDSPTYDWKGFVLTPQQRTIVELLHKHLGHTVSRERMLDAIFQGDDEHLTTPRKHIDVYICAIRKRIANSPFEIKTVWGEGFAMIHKTSALAMTALQELQAH